jgi:hypothetical protein
MRNTTSPFLRVLKLVTACALLATVPLGLGTVSSAGLNNYVSASSEYVALGDSYASGEGLQSNATTYISPSNNDGCHRSVTAYPVLVAASLNVDLGQWLCCVLWRHVKGPLERRKRRTSPTKCAVVSNALGHGDRRRR